MKYEYEYTIKPSDLWQASMYYAYSSYLAVINVVCIISSIALLFKLWATSPDWLRALLILFLLLFTVIQPFIVYMKARLSLKGQLTNIKLSFSESQIEIKADGNEQKKSWRNVRGIVKKPTILIVYMEDGNGYILRNSVMHGQKEEFYDFAKKMIANNR